MTELLEQAFAEVSKLPPDEQDLIADWLLKEMESECRWNQLFAESQDALPVLASEALAEHRKGDTLSCDAKEP